MNYLKITFLVIFHFFAILGIWRSYITKDTREEKNRLLLGAIILFCLLLASGYYDIIINIFR